MLQLKEEASKGEKEQKHECYEKKKKGSNASCAVKFHSVPEHFEECFAPLSFFLRAMVGQLDISTPGGQQILYDFVNWRISGHRPIPPIGSKEYWNSRPNLFHVLEEGGFRTAAKKIAPVAVGKMKQEDFDMLIGILQGKKHKLLRAKLRKDRHENPCDGLEIKPPFPFASIPETVQEVKAINWLNRNNPAGRQLMLDFVNHRKTGFHPTDRVGRVEHWKSRPEYQKVSKHAFRSAAIKIAKDVARHLPDEVEMAKIFEDACQAANQRKKLRSSKQKSNYLNKNGPPQTE